MPTYEIGIQPAGRPGQTDIFSIDADDKDRALDDLRRRLHEDHQSIDSVRWVQETRWAESGRWTP